MIFQLQPNHVRAFGTPEEVQALYEELVYDLGEKRGRVQRLCLYNPILGTFPLGLWREAETALRSGKSLLPIGVTAVDGRFERGDAVIVRGPSGAEIARGLVAYDSDEARRLVGRRSSEIETVLGYPGRAAMIHRDDLVVV